MEFNVHLQWREPSLSNVDAAARKRRIQQQQQQQQQQSEPKPEAKAALLDVKGDVKLSPFIKSFSLQTSKTKQSAPNPPAMLLCFPFLLPDSGIEQVVEGETEYPDGLQELAEGTVHQVTRALSLFYSNVRTPFFTGISR